MAEAPVSYYGISGDAECVYMGIGRFIEDFVLLSPDIIKEDLRYYLLGRFGNCEGEVELTPAMVREIEERFNIYAEALKDRKHRRIPASVRQQVMERDDHRCVVCESTEGLALDHILPFSRGGKHNASNLQVLCRTCNSSKGAKTMDEWGRDD